MKATRIDSAPVTSEYNSALRLLLSGSRLPHRAPAAAYAAHHQCIHQCIKGVDHCVFSCNNRFRNLRREIGQYLVDTTPFHLAYFISREGIRCPLD